VTEWPAIGCGQTAAAESGESPQSEKYVTTDQKVEVEQKGLAVTWLNL
jgi:hypothetical protein